MPEGRWVWKFIGVLTNIEKYDIMQPSEKQYEINVLKAGRKERENGWML